MTKQLALQPTNLILAFPEDDELKEEVETTRWRQEQVQARLTGDCEALEILSRADALMNLSRHLLSEAAGYPRWGTFVADICCDKYLSAS